MASLYSPSWHAVADLKPRLAEHVQVHRRVFRGQTWYVLQDTVNHRFHRMAPGAYAIVSAMNGQRSIGQLWEAALQHANQDLPGQEQLVQLLGQLHAQDLLVADVRPDQAELLRRHHKQKWAQWRRSLFNLASLKWALWNPDAFLGRLAPRLGWLFGWPGLVLWLLTVLPALDLAATHWTELTENLADRALSPDNLLILWLVFPVVKALHELGHGLATKVWGGRVLETGIIWMLFAPIPYVDTSSAYAFEDKKRRVLVSAMGILVEVWLAAVAMAIWAGAAPGEVRTVAFNVMLIAGVSTLMVNGNPLMRFDGYFVLSDLIEMPNLAQRASALMVNLSDRLLFRAPGLPASSETFSERVWLISYGVVSFIYRISISVALILLIAGEYFFLGVLLALSVGWGMVGMPLWKAYRHVHNGASLFRVRQRALRLFWGGMGAFALVIFAVPLPHYSLSEGVVWLPDQAIVRAEMDGFVDTVLVEPGQRVQAGQPVAWLRQGTVQAELEQATAALDEAQARHRQSLTQEPLQSAVTQEQLKQAQVRLTQAQGKAAQLAVLARADGVFTRGQATELQNQYVRRGDLIGAIASPNLRPVVRVAVSQDDIDLVRRDTQGVALRTVHEMAQVRTGRLTREVPSGQHALPAPALGVQGGGSIATDPRDEKGLTGLQRWFQFDVAVDDASADLRWIGSRVYVRFDHGMRPLAAQWFIRLRQVFMRYFHV